MKPALVLIDLQRDYLAAAGMEPAAGQIVARAADLLALCRRRGMPVVHVWTTVHRSPDDRMEHWKQAGLWRCEEGTPGHAVPEALRPAPGEAVVHKQCFSGFAGPALDEALRGCDTMVLAGVHLHACIRATALDAYARGLGVWVAADAVGSDDPLHAAITRRYLAERCVRFAEVDALAEALTHAKGAARAGEAAVETTCYEHRSPADVERVAWRVPVMGREAIAAAAGDVEDMRRRDRPRAGVLAALGRVAQGLLENLEEFAVQITADVGKPIRMARGEVRRSAELLQAVAREAERPAQNGTGPTWVRRMPLGIVGLITPWNNPLAIPVGKLAPALAYGNGVLWKPAPAGSMVAQKLLALWRQCDETAPLALVTGDQGTALAVASDARIDALTLSGSLAAGHALAEIAARRHLPWQAEMGGNNAAIIGAEADMPRAARDVASGALGFAGQRCTANRRVIVPAEQLEEWCEALAQAARELPWGDPTDERTVIGPVISRGKQRQLEALVARTHEAGCRVLATHADAAFEKSAPRQRGAFFAPAIVVCANADQEIVQEESFGPILVVQPAQSFDEALALCNGVKQGLAAALFGGTRAQRDRFLAEARAGILKLNQSTSDADAVSPFGGWKASGAGPAEHGSTDREFYTRVQTVYGLPADERP